MQRENSTHEDYLRHVAFMIAADLPENVTDARYVLALLHEIVDKFYTRPAPADLRVVMRKPDGS